MREAIFPKGFVFTPTDYSAIEKRILASVQVPADILKGKR